MSEYLILKTMYESDKVFYRTTDLINFMYERYSICPVDSERCIKYLIDSRLLKRFGAPDSSVQLTDSGYFRLEALKKQLELEQQTKEKFEHMKKVDSRNFVLAVISLIVGTAGLVVSIIAIL